MTPNKYVIVNNGFVDVIVVFPEVLKHSDFTESFSNIVSAGYIKLTDNGMFECYGKSTSLGIESRPFDTDIANRQLFPDPD